MIYTIHMKAGARPLPGDETGETLFDSLVAVPECNAILAALFPPFWLVYHRLWFALIAYLALIIIMMSFLTTPFALAVLVLGGLPGIYLFLEGNQLRRYKLLAQGYDLVGVVDASERRFAVEEFLFNWQEPKEASGKPARIIGRSDRQETGISMFVEAEV